LAEDGEKFEKSCENKGEFIPRFCRLQVEVTQMCSDNFLIRFIHGGGAVFEHYSINDFLKFRFRALGIFQELFFDKEQEFFVFLSIFVNKPVKILFLQHFEI